MDEDFLVADPADRPGVRRAYVTLAAGQERGPRNRIAAGLVARRCPAADAIPHDAAAAIRALARGGRR